MLKDTGCRKRARLAVCVTVFAALIGAFTIVGCSRSVLSMDNITIEAEIEQAASRYYNVYGEWPKSMNDLRAPRPGGDQRFKRLLSDAIARIIPEASKCKITFVTKPDGRLSIEVLGPNPGDSISEEVDIPHTTISH